MSTRLVDFAGYDQALREALSRITQGNVREHRARIRALQSRHNHAISLVEEAGELPYHCVRYAFDLIDLPGNIRKAIDHLESWRRQRQLPRLDPLDTVFVNFLIEQRRVLHGRNSAESGSIIVYLGEERVQHVGKIQGELVNSKWNNLGHLWQHRIYEVPIGYGADVRFFESLPRDEAVPQLLSFIEVIRAAPTPPKHKQLRERLHH